MTNSERKIIKALGWGNDPVRSDILAKAVKLTVRGLAIVIDRMERRNLVVVTRNNGWFVELSFGGHRLKEREGI